MGASASAPGAAKGRAWAPNFRRLRALPIWGIHIQTKSTFICGINGVGGGGGGIGFYNNREEEPNFSIFPESLGPKGRDWCGSKGKDDSGPLATLLLRKILRWEKERKRER